MPHRQAVIVFVKNPQTDPVKTRIAAILGEGLARAVYQRLVNITQEAVLGLPYRKFVFYGVDINPNDNWTGVEKFQQVGTTLGERLLHAFQIIFEEEEIHRAVVIGSDCPEITDLHLHKALRALETHDCVLGPATDGGYYLLGLKEPFEKLFSLGSWSTPTLAQETMECLRKNKMSCYLLPSLSDLDEAKDIPEEWL